MTDPEADPEWLQRNVPVKQILKLVIVVLQLYLMCTSFVTVNSVCYAAAIQRLCRWWRLAP